MSDVTRILTAIGEGDPSAPAQLLPLVYEELRRLAAVRMAAERPDHSLTPTALVHEAYLRLVGAQAFDHRGHFFAAAAEAMRRILVENARRRTRARHGGNLQRVDLDSVAPTAPDADEELVALSEALDQFALVNPQAAELVKLRYFGGMTGREAAEVLGVSPRRADQIWAYARGWLLERLESAD
ncbi:MAG TPA: ECF-type sigma factor [Gemmataceae bacterium]|nr:ECF-type sigma factor [Gemmataceae bacterium]